MSEQEQLERFLWEQDKADRQLLWDRYKLLTTEGVDYLRIVLNFTMFYYGITGAIISFIISRPDPLELKIAFLIPALMGIGSGATYLYFLKTSILPMKS